MASIGPYYDIGTATLTVGSATVTGQSTNWLTARLRPGDQIESNTGQRATILSINSNTSITLDRVYAGTAQAAGAYKVWRTPDANELLDKARSAFDLLGSGSVAAWAGLTLAADKLPYGTGPGTLGLTDLPAASRTQIAAGLGNAATKTVQNSTLDETAGRLMAVGAFGLGSLGIPVPNGDYNLAKTSGLYAGAGAGAINSPPAGTQYGGLLVIRRASTVVVQLAFGELVTANRWTLDDGATWTSWMRSDDASNLTTGTVPDARVSNTLTPDKAFRRGNIIGTVSQSGGIPTGASIERGSNANGEYVRFADGTQICWFNGSASFPIDTPYISVFQGSVNLTYPVAFTDLPAVTTSGRRASQVGVSQASNVSSTAFVFRIVDWTSRSAGLNDVLYVAIGRWF